MKEEELNRLFDQARHSKPEFLADDILQDVFGRISGFKTTLSNWLKGIGIALAAGMLIFVAFVQISGPNKGIENIESAGKPNINPSNTSDGISNESIVDSSVISLTTTTEGYTAPLSSIYKKEATITEEHPQQPKKGMVMRGDIDKLLMVQSRPSQIFEIDADRDTILLGKRGSQWFIESYTFCDDKRAVVKGKIKFELKECFTVADFMLENLGTQSDEILLESAGMFYLNAMQNSDTLKIRKGYEIGFRPPYLVEDKMDLYYGQKDAFNTVNWALDSLGRKPSPVLIAIRGKYSDVMNNWFYKNYKLDKESLMDLQDSTWTQHFTSDKRKVIGNKTCHEEEGAFKTACETFNNEISRQLAEHENFNALSRMTDFTFYCMSKNQYTYALEKGYVDSFRNYVPPSDFNQLNIPIFFPRNLGWGNMDCIPNSFSIKWKKMEKPLLTDLKFTIPEQLNVNAFLYLPEQKSMVREINRIENNLVFSRIPLNQKAYLVITSLYNDVFYVFKAEINSSDAEPLSIQFEKIQDSDVYINWLKNAIPDTAL